MVLNYLLELGAGSSGSTAGEGSLEKENIFF
jgi:hypothetical protein